MLRIRCLMHLTLIGVCLSVVTFPGIHSTESETPEARVARILKKHPLIDAHNDLPLNLRSKFYNQLEKFDMNSDLTKDFEWMSMLSQETHTDIPRMIKGGIGVQFWAAFTKCESQYKDSVEQTLEQIDVINRVIVKNKKHLQYAQSTAGIKSALKNGKIASLIGVEGGHSIQSSLGILRILYDLGTRYLTLTHTCNTPWADSSHVDNATAHLDPINGGISAFGLKVVDEMNRLGMIVDISHTSVEAQRKVLEHSKAPIMYSHSSAFAICKHHRNVHDDILELVGKHKGVVMVNFYSTFLKCDGTRGNLKDVVEHIEHIRKMAGIDSLGFGSDFDGVEVLPEGLEDVSKYPDLLKALAETGRWSDEDLEKIISTNFLRVFGEVEAVRRSLKHKAPIDDVITREDLKLKKADMTAITANFPGDPKPGPNV